LCLPDWIVNAGGVICASAEYAGQGPRRAFENIAQTIRDNTSTVIRRSREGSMLPRLAAEQLAMARVREAMSFRRSWSDRITRQEDAGAT
jgi:glutamate dehydrogenase (NAD(P)+)